MQSGVELFLDTNWMTVAAQWAKRLTNAEDYKWTMRLSAFLQRSTSFQFERVKRETGRPRRPFHDKRRSLQLYVTRTTTNPRTACADSAARFRPCFETRSKFSVHFRRTFCSEKLEKLHGENFGTVFNEYSMK